MISTESREKLQSILDRRDALNRSIKFDNGRELLRREWRTLSDEEAAELTALDKFINSKEGKAIYAQVAKEQQIYGFIHQLCGQITIRHLRMNGIGGMRIHQDQDLTDLIYELLNKDAEE